MWGMERAWSRAVCLLRRGSCHQPCHCMGREWGTAENFHSYIPKSITRMRICPILQKGLGRNLKVLDTTSSSTCTWVKPGGKIDTLLLSLHSVLSAPNLELSPHPVLHAPNLEISLHPVLPALKPRAQPTPPLFQLSVALYLLHVVSTHSSAYTYRTQ